MKLNRQFGRFVEVEIRDFDNKVKTLIGNEFEIEFDYFKTLDQTQEDDSGKIRIFGLTAERTQSLQTEGGEVRLRCGYTSGEVHTLFIASIARLYANTENNTTVTTIECSANLMHYYHTGSSSTGIGVNGSMSAYQFLKNTVEGGEIEANAGISRAGAGRTKSNVFQFSVSNIPENKRSIVKEFLLTSAVRLSIVGNKIDMLANICQVLGLASTTKDVGETRYNTFSVNNSAVANMIRLAEGGYEKVKFDPNTVADDSLFFGTLKTEEDENEVIVLSNLSGLLESKIEYKIATAYADQVEYSGTDVETLSSKQKRSDVESKNAKNKGKDYKAVRAVKSTTVQVTRQYNRVKALLNPLIRPQSMVLVFESSEVDDKYKEVGGETRVVSNPKDEFATPDGSYGKYRVRNVTYKGNNRRDDWVMDLYCESTDDIPATEDNIKKFLATVPSEDVEFTQVGSAEEGID